MICPKCGKNINDNVQFCSSCGAKTSIDNIRLSSKATFVISALSIIISFFAVKTIVAAIGLVFGAVALVSAIVLYSLKIKDKLSILNLVLSVIGLLSNFGWLAYLLWVLPTL